MRELHPVLVLIVRSRARQLTFARKGSRIAREPVHQQPRGVDGEDLLARKRAQPQPSGPTAALSQRPRR